MFIDPNEIIHVGKQGVSLSLNLLIDPVFRVQPSPKTKLIEEIHTAFLCGVGHGVEGFADAVIDFLFAEPFNLIG